MTTTTERAPRTRGDNRRGGNTLPGAVVEYVPNTIGNWVAVEDRDKPWITIGGALKGSSGTGTTVDRVMTAEEVLRATDLDIKVLKVPLKDADTGKIIPKAFVTCYDDADPAVGRVYFGTVSDKYEVVGPRTALGMFDPLVAAIPGAGYTAAWNMREKAMFGVTIDLPMEVVVDPKGANDRVGTTLLGIEAFDGSSSIAGAVTTTRFWCMNQLTPSLFGVPRAFRLRHTKNVTARATEAAANIGLVTDYLARFQSVADGLYAAKMSDRAFETFLAKLEPFALDGGETDLIEARIKERRAEAVAAWRAPNNENISGTKWGALNVVAEFLQWGRTVSGSKRTGTDPVRQRAIGSMVHSSVTRPVNDALEILLPGTVGRGRNSIV